MSRNRTAEIENLLSQGLASKEVAARTGLSHHRVKEFATNFNAANRPSSDAVRYDLGAEERFLDALLRDRGFPRLTEKRFGNGRVAAVGPVFYPAAVSA